MTTQPQMKKFVFRFVTLFGFFAALAPSSHQVLAAAKPVTNPEQTVVYFMNGGPVDWHPPQIYRAQATLQKFMDERFPDVFFKVLHNSAYLSVCSEIKTFYKVNPEVRIIVAGHSYGGQGTIDVSKCLDKAKIAIKRTITIDPVQKPFFPSPRIIPDNIESAFNFAQKTDPALYGIQKLERKDGSQFGIENTLLETGTDYGAHFDIVEKLTKEGILQSLIEEAILAP